MKHMKNSMMHVASWSRRVLHDENVLSTLESSFRILKETISTRGTGFLHGLTDVGCADGSWRIDENQLCGVGAD